MGKKTITLITQVQTIRKKINISVEVFRDQLNSYLDQRDQVHTSTVYNWFNGDNSPNAECVIALQEWVRQNDK